jgi:hypothetical protein
MADNEESVNEYSILIVILTLVNCNTVGTDLYE